MNFTEYLQKEWPESYEVVKNGFPGIMLFIEKAAEDYATYKVRSAIDDAINSGDGTYRP